MKRHTNEKENVKCGYFAYALIQRYLFAFYYENIDDI